MSDPVGATLEAIGRLPVLPPEQQLHLARQVQAWLQWSPDDGPCPPQIIRRGQRARQRLVETNLRLVVSICTRHRRRFSNEDFLDLIQEGSIGLTRAVEKFDPSRGYSFTTYAFAWIKQSIGRALHTQFRTIRLPEHFSWQKSKLEKLIASYQEEHGRRPSIAWLSTHSGFSERQIRSILVIGFIKLLSFDQACSADNPDGTPLLELIPAPQTPADQLAEQHERINLANRLINSLPDQDRDLVQAVLINGMTHKEYATTVGMSSSWVGLRKKKIFRHLQAAVAA